MFLRRRPYFEQIAYAVQLESLLVRVTVHEPVEAGKLPEVYWSSPVTPLYPPLTTNGLLAGHVTVAVVPVAA